jgi:GNAT superfamily N-acetyltransferase
VEEGAHVFRSPVNVRDARPDDAEELVGVWGGSTGRAPDRDPSPRPGEAAGAVARIAADPEQRLLVAFIDDHLAGAAHLTRGSVTPICGEEAVYLLHLQVQDEFRRHGVGRALVEATVSWAEEKGTSYVIAAAAVASRDANRFMARLGLGQVAVVRAATVASLRAKLPVDPPAAARVGSRSTRTAGQVLVQRRSLRRARRRAAG